MPIPLSQQDIVLLRENSRKNPDKWIEQILACQLWLMQQQIAKAVFRYPKVSVRSCTGSGKTYLAGRLVLAFLGNYAPSIVLTTAPTFRQVESILWKEIGAAYGKVTYENGFGGWLKTTRLEMGAEWFAMGLSTDQPERFQGYHSENMLVIGDEASGLSDEVYRAIETPLSTGNAHLLLISNPTQPVGMFRDTFDLDSYKHFHISAFDTPNFASFGITLDDIRNDTWMDKCGVRKQELEEGMNWLKRLPCPYLINPQWVADRLREWGEGSFSFQCYVLGEFPKKGLRNLFNLAEVEKAVDREVDESGDVKAALDVARYGDCKTVYGLRRGEKVFGIQTWGHEGIHYTTGRVARHLRGDNPEVLYVDAGGIGVDDCDILVGEGFNINRVLSNNPAVDKERFVNRRAELYWMLSQRFTDERISIPNDRELISQLADIQYDYRNGRVIMESKEQMRARGSKSPDKADFLAMLFYPEEPLDDMIPEPWTF